MQQTWAIGRRHRCKVGMEPHLPKQLGESDASQQYIASKPHNTLNTCVNDHHEFVIFLSTGSKCEKIKWIGIWIPALKWPLFSKEE